MSVLTTGGKLCMSAAVYPKKMFDIISLLYANLGLAEMKDKLIPTISHIIT